MTTPGTQSKLLVGPISGAGDRLRLLVRELQGDEPLNPVTVIVPTTYVALTLRRSMGRDGIANVRFTTFPRVSELLGAPALTATGMLPLTSLLETAAVRAVADEATGVLAASKDHPQTHRSLKSTFRELRSASEPALRRLEDANGVPAETMRLFRRFRETTADRYDREDLALSAAESLTHGDGSLLDEMGPVTVYLPRDFSPGERRVVEALAELSRCVVVLGLTDDDEADVTMDELVGRLTPALGVPERWSSDQQPGESSLLVAPDAHQEVRWTIRSLVKAAEEGVHFGRMGVLYRSQEPYGTLIAEELGLAGIPISGPDTTTLAQRAAGRTLLALLRLSNGDLTRDDVMDVLATCPVSSPGASNGGLRTARWDAISRNAGVVRGIDQWRERLDRYGARLRDLARRSEEQGEAEGAQADAMREDADEVGSLKAFIESLGERLDAPGDGSSWGDFSNWARGLIDAYLDHDAVTSEPESAAEQRVVDVLSELAGADAFDRRSSLAVFIQAVEEALQESIGQLGPTGQGVFVAQLGSAIGFELDRVHVVGMVEGAMPPKTRDDPLVPDRERREAGGEAAGVPLQSARRARERYDFLAGVAMAQHRVLSYPRADLVGGRAQSPSRWLLQEATRSNGASVFASSLLDLPETPWLVRIASVQASLDGASRVTPADGHDYDVDSFRQWLSSGRTMRRHPLAESTGLASALDLETSRNSRTLTEWDGDVSAAFAAGSGVDLTLREPHSPTSLERWARCPFSYFLGNILRIGNLERPEDVASITALDKGSLVHDILEQFVRSAVVADDVPHPGQLWSAKQRATLFDIAARAFTVAESKGVTGKALLWRIERVGIESDLESFLEQDSRTRQRFGSSPMAVEARFGMGDAGEATGWAPATIDVDGVGSLKFRGMIDRVDATPSGDELLVLDYKTGSSGSYSVLKNDPVDRGRRLQLAVYSLAAAGANPGAKSVRAAYWFVTTRGGFKIAPETPVSLDEFKDDFRSAVATIVSGVHKGLFPANPGGESQGTFDNCRLCDFKTLCPSYRDVAWNRKKGDERLAPYLALLEEEGAESR